MILNTAAELRFHQLLPSDKRRPGWLHALHGWNKGKLSCMADILHSATSSLTIIFCIGFFFRALKKCVLWRKTKFCNTQKEKKNLPSRVFVMPVSCMKEAVNLFSCLLRIIRMVFIVWEGLRPDSLSHMKFKFQIFAKHTGFQLWRCFTALLC